MNNQLEISLVENIGRTFREAQQLADNATSAGRAAILKARECGQYLREAKEMAGHGGWMAWFTANSTMLSNMNLKTAQRWMQLADIPMSALESMQSLKQAYLALGILPTVEREAGSQTAQPDSQKWLTGILNAWEKLSISIERRPIIEWPEPQRITLKEKLRPLAELYSQL